MSDDNRSIFKEAVIVGILLSLAIELVAPGVIDVMEWISPVLPFLIGILILLVCFHYYRKKRWFSV
jgi:hypothetical protein